MLQGPLTRFKPSGASRRQFDQSSALFLFCLANMAWPGYTATVCASTQASDPSCRIPMLRPSWSPCTKHWAKLMCLLRVLVSDAIPLFHDCLDVAVYVFSMAPNDRTGCGLNAGLQCRQSVLPQWRITASKVSHIKMALLIAASPQIFAEVIEQCARQTTSIIFNLDIPLIRE